MSGNQKPVLAYQFFRNYAEKGNAFTVSDIAKHVGWEESTARTYINKKWKDYLISKPAKAFQVRNKFLRVTEQQFLAEFTQTETVETTYVREKHSQFIQFEFLLPLTREDKLRRALDDLFYKDTIEMRLKDLGIETVQNLIEREAGMTEADYIEKVCGVVSDKFGGYSIVHVQGRYKAAELMTRSEAAQYFAADQLYLVDETTASVRFIIPCTAGSMSFEDDFQSINQTAAVEQTELEKEVALIRTLFFQFFVEAVVATVHNEEEVWLLETGHVKQLYRWRRTAKKR